jgi:hypothetical protein
VLCVMGGLEIGQRMILIFSVCACSVGPVEVWRTPYPAIPVAPPLDLPVSSVVRLRRVVWVYLISRSSIDGGECGVHDLSVHLTVQLATCVECMCGASTLWQVVLKDWDEIAS